MPSHQATNPPPTKARKAKTVEAISDPRAGLHRLKDFTRQIMAVPKEEAEPPKKKPK
jgi:hypothetical protein